MKDLKEKIKSFDINWEGNDNHVKLQQDIDQNKTFRIYKEEISEPNRPDIQANQLEILQKQKYSLQDIETMSQEQLKSRIFVVNSSETSLIDLKVEGTTFYKFEHQKFINDD